MADVARTAGVHVTTVSLALRNHPSLPSRTRERLQRLARQMGYAPDPALSALVSYRHGAGKRKDQPPIAYVTNWDSALGWKNFTAHRDFFEGAVAKAATLGYQMEHFWLGEPGMTARRMSGILTSRGITGIVVASQLAGADTPLDFDWGQFSAVKIDFSPREPQLHMVTNDQSAVVRLATQRVRVAGYRRIGFVMPLWWDEFVDRAWSAGYSAEQLRIEPAGRIPILYYSEARLHEHLSTGTRDHSVPAGALKAWVREHQPEVIISREVFVLPSLAKLQLHVPDDLAFAEIFLEETNGRVAGVRQNCRRVGEVAVELLVGQMHQHVVGVPEIPTATYVEGTWFDGRTLPECHGLRRTGEKAK